MDKALINETYKLWCEHAKSDPDLVTELKSIAGDDEAILDRFYRELEFGTAGLRGVIGAGPNRMNYYTVRKATQGFADYINAQHAQSGTGGSPASVAIAYDSRIKSDYFSQTAAEVLAGNGIKVHMYKELMPTPMLSFAVRYLKCDAGINVTASHNPAKFNGYKAYRADGCQIGSEEADAVLANCAKIDTFSDTDNKTMSFQEGLEKGLINYIADEVSDAYFAEIKKEAIHPESSREAGLKVVYTPLNGAGNKPVRRILAEVGITDVIIVPEQENPDGNFPTCLYPNPESAEALKLGLELCKKVQPDLLLATDPDCDRVGIAVPDGKGGYALFSGNETGVMLLEYIARERIAMGTMPERAVAIKSVVSTTLTDKICAEYNVEMVDVLTGFKNIGEYMHKLESKGELNRFIFGFEESYGYLAGNEVRDKDAVVASMLICEMTAFYRSKGISLIEARAKMYEKYGVFQNSLDNFAFEGASGMEKMGRIMQGLRDNYPKSIADVKVTFFSDFGSSKKLNLFTGEETRLKLPKTNMVFFDLEGGASIIVRPSGTEPKIKVYYTTVGKTFEEAEAIQKKFAAEVAEMMK